MGGASIALAGNEKLLADGNGWSRMELTMGDPGVSIGGGRKRLGSVFSRSAIRFCSTICNQRRAEDHHHSQVADSPEQMKHSR